MFWFIALQVILFSIDTVSIYLTFTPLLESRSSYVGSKDLVFFLSFNQDLKSLSSTYYIQFSSVAQSCPVLCDPMKRSTPGLPVHHQLLEFTQTHVH